MNKIITTFATLLLTTAVIAAPGGRGGNRGNGGGGHGTAPARQTQQVRQRTQTAKPAVRNTRPAENHTARPAGNHTTRPAMRPNGHDRGVAHRPQPMHRRHWTRPPMPPPRPHACYTWTWIATPWTILLDGVYCTGDGYWFDGYNYYYNDGYYTNAPVSLNLNIAF